MPRVGLSPDAVVDAAVAVIDADGPDALSLAAVASRTGVATPSLYKHVSSLDALRTLVQLRVITELGDELARAVLGRSADDALRALMNAYHGYAVTHPNRYAALPQQPRSDPALARAGDRAIEVILAVLRGYGLEGSAAIHATRCVRAAMHGFASLEISGGFQLAEDLGESHRLLVDTVVAGFGR
ncbi:TetR-like C-terminal domain-containing protein [Kutzneria sp. 744]|uniref:TetR-like C-terminal domain-containing protein n=1 Tax=Kutzneria sp. (strain 744) TaxID=345341 RepID=UPI0003EEDA5E|nr:TetR-like C-terminal domain-containing protein [Kutzneria sp. 744]EWM16327.1 transcriptional regulator [Kutzneria sp. 744]